VWSWCNVPSGETFIVPDRDATHGSVFINGSVPNFPIPTGHAMRLDVREGRVRAPIRCSDHESLRAAAEKYLLRADGREAVLNCTVVSELGIGLNPWIDTFTGIPIFDEKVAGTVHLGFGSSLQFDGPTHSKMHNDFVIRDPTVWIDGCRAVDAGRLLLTEAEVFPNWSTVPAGRLDPRRKVMRTGNAYQEERKAGRILARRQWISDRSEGPTSTQVGDEETAAIATQILWGLDNQGGQLSVQEVRDSVPDAVPEGAVEKTLELLLAFRLVEQEDRP
jgi:hypothetical protein